MPYIVKANRSKIETRIERLSRYLELQDSSFDGFVNWIVALRTELGIPHSLAEIGIDTAQVEKIGQMAVNDLAASGNPIQFTEQQYSNICLAAVNGNLLSVTSY
jgi:alcohol dehydrogenase class IV